VLAGRCAEMLQGFFRLRRIEKSSVVSPQSSATNEHSPPELADD